MFSQNYVSWGLNERNPLEFPCHIFQILLDINRTTHNASGSTSAESPGSALTTSSPEPARYGGRLPIRSVEHHVYNKTPAQTKGASRKSSHRKLQALPLPGDSGYQIRALIQS